MEISTFRSPLRRHKRTHFYKYASATTALAIVKNRTLRWSSPLAFNDPFDVPKKLDLGFSPEQLVSETVRLFDYLIESAIEPPGTFGELVRQLRLDRRPAVRREILESLRSMTTAQFQESGHLFNEFKDTWASLLPRLRVLCLSEAADSTVMWAHYSDQHRGAVLRLECLDSFDSATLLAEPIIYRNEPPRLPSAEYWARTFFDLEKIDWQDFFREYHYTKSTDWSYEREWRVLTYALDHEQGLISYTPFRPQELTSVTVGVEATPEFISELKELLRDDLGHVRLRRAELDHEQRIIAEREL
jgi:hypothetical protein